MANSKTLARKRQQTVQCGLDDALEDSFPCSDPVSFLQASPVKEAYRPLCTVKGNKQGATSRAK
jgi:hypothetical protein